MEDPGDKGKAQAVEAAANPYSTHEGEPDLFVLPMLLTHSITTQTLSVSRMCALHCTPAQPLYRRPCAGVPLGVQHCPLPAPQPAECATCCGCWMPRSMCSLMAGGAPPTPSSTTTSWQAAGSQCLSAFLSVVLLAHPLAMKLACSRPLGVSPGPNPASASCFPPPLQATGGMRSFLQQFAYCLGLLRALPPAPPAGAAGTQQLGDTEMAEPSAAAAAAASSSGPAAGEAAPPAGGSVDWLNSYRQSVEGTVGTYLVLMTNMRCAAVHAGCCWVPSAPAVRPAVRRCLLSLLAHAAPRSGCDQ